MADAVSVISSVLEEMDKEYATYQELYRKYHRTDDEVAKLIHRHLVDLCRRLLKDIPRSSE